MARRPPPPTPQPAVLSLSDMQRAIPRLRRRLAEVEAFDPNAAQRDDPDAAVRGLRLSIQEALTRTFGTDTVEAQRYRGAAYFDYPMNMLDETPIGEIRESFARCRQQSIDLLSGAIAMLEERIAEEGAEPDGPPVEDSPAATTANRRVFIVHGRDVATRESVARLLERADFRPVILQEQTNQGRTIVEKFEAQADVGFAVVILNPEDEGRLMPDGDAAPRARQNVVLELGYFIGRLGRNRVCILKAGALELPSDVLGFGYTEFDAAGAWKSELAKELLSAGYSVDWNKVMIP
jgi:predicted nucleotide-binding protein